MPKILVKVLLAPTRASPAADSVKRGCAVTRRVMRRSGAMGVRAPQRVVCVGLRYN